MAQYEALTESTEHSSHKVALELAEWGYRIP